jgi:hypothetical protein
LFVLILIYAVPFAHSALDLIHLRLLSIPQNPAQLLVISMKFCLTCPQINHSLLLLHPSRLHIYFYYWMDSIKNCLLAAFGPDFNMLKEGLMFLFLTNITILHT